MEAAFMTGLERNADVVEMATYAPLLAHVEGWQWRPDMIWFDNLRSMPTASYYVQQLYSLNKGEQTVPLTLDGKAAAGNENQNGLFASAVKMNASGDLIVKVVNTSDTPQEISIEFKGLKKNQSYSHLEEITLHSDNPDTENTLDAPNVIVPTASSCVLQNPVTPGSHVFSSTIGPKTFTIYKFTK